MLDIFHNTTIRIRLFLLFLVVIFAVIGLVALYTFNVSALKGDMYIMEDLYRFSNNVLELRRFEKNFLYGHDPHSLDQINYYLSAINKTSHHFSQEFIDILGKQAFSNFQDNVKRYEDLIKNPSKISNADPDRIRKLGKGLVNFTEKLLLVKRNRIHKKLHYTMYGFILATSGGFMLILLIFHIQTRNILLRIKKVQQATGAVALGEFKPIKDQSSHKDEISSLIQAFNKMVEEIDSNQEQLLQAKKLAAVGTFSSGIAHELNNPLNNISLTADTLQEEYESLSREEVLDMVHDIISEGERAATVVRNLLDFCRKRPPSSQLLSIKDVIKKSANLVSNQLKIQHIWFEDYIPESLPPIRGDAQKLQQVFVNLFVNSMQAMSDGGLIDVCGMAKGKYVKVRFSDTGKGIPSEKIEHIFEPFFTTKPVGKGTGLGLSLVYGIIKKHGGYIEVESKENVGTTFIISLPIANETESKR
ncbi:MAG: HAMP domain-containing protein [Nitrospiraceae bacterium]|nr:HAMP domain-containing protein [Nitrospiraceae bacterium]